MAFPLPDETAAQNTQRRKFMKLRILALATALVTAAHAASAFEPKKGNGDQGIVVTGFSAGLTDPNGAVPTLDGVPGAGIHNWDIATPKALLQSGNAYTYQMSFQSLSYSGTCKATYKLTQKQGGKNVVLDSGTIIDTFDCTAPTNWVFAVTSPHVIPSAPGPATLTGTLTLQGGKIVTDVPVMIQ
jgi:hypothetical protein